MLRLLEKLSGAVPRKGDSVKILVCERDNDKKTLPQSTVSLGNLVPHVRVQGLQIVLAIYRSGV